MTIAEYNAMHEAKGTPKVWIVNYTIGSGGLVSSMIFATEQEARSWAAKFSHVVDVYRTWDIWNWTKRQNGAGK